MTTASYNPNVYLTASLANPLGLPIYCLTSSYNPPTYYSASCYMTSSYTIASEYEPIVSKDKGVREYFVKLGYKVFCDSNRRSHEFWYEICDNDGCVVQIDQGVPLEDIIMDICEFHNGRPGISKSDYKLSGPKSKRMTLLFKQVHDLQMYGIEPNGQYTFRL